MDIPDGDLVRLARDGDPAAFRLLVERHLPMARTRAARLCPQPDDADDAVQDAFLQAFMALDRLRDPDRFAGWLGGILTNVCRVQRRRAPLTLLGDWPENLHPASDDNLPSAEDLDRADVLSHVLVVLADTVPAKDGSHRALPVRLRVPYDKLWRLLSRPGDLTEEDLLNDDRAEETTGLLLRAAGVTPDRRDRYRPGPGSDRHPAGITPPSQNSPWSGPSAGCRRPRVRRAGTAVTAGRGGVSIRPAWVREVGGGSNGRGAGRQAGRAGAARRGGLRGDGGGAGPAVASLSRDRGSGGARADRAGRR